MNLYALINIQLYRVFFTIIYGFIFGAFFAKCGQPEPDVEVTTLYPKPKNLTTTRPELDR